MDTVELIASLEKITGKDTTKQKQNSLNVSDVWHLWDILVAKYDTIEVINVLFNFAKDEDLKYLAKDVLKEIEKGARLLEQTMLEYAIPLPLRPPQNADSTINVESVTDRYIFNRIFELTKQMIPLLATAFVNGSAPVAIKIFKTYIIEKMELVDNLSVYGEAKGYLGKIPQYMP